MAWLENPSLVGTVNLKIKMRKCEVISSPFLSLGRSCIFVEIFKLSNVYISLWESGHYFQVSAHSFYVGAQGAYVHINILENQ